MTVSSSTDRASFPGNGVATAFSLPFRFFANSDVVVQAIVDSTGVATPLTLGVDYTLTGAGQPEEAGAATGVLTTSAPVPVGVSLFVQRIIPATQPTDIVNQGRFFPEVHETVFDRLTMLVQQGEGALSRTLRVQDFDPAPGRLPSALSRALKIMSFDENGNPVAIDAARDSSLVLRQDLAEDTDPAKGAAMIGRATVSAGSVFALLAAKRDPSQALLVTSYHGGWAAEVRAPVGGGSFVWDAARAKSAHNGGTIISPTVPWDGNRATLGNFLRGVGETEPAGSGCWVRVRDGGGVVIDWFGAIGNDAFDNAVVIQSALNAESTSEVIVPLGSFRYTASPVIPEGVSIRGLGLGSVLRPVGCHGLSFTYSNTIGARYVRNLHIYGQGVGSPYDGIVFDSGTDQLKRTTGVVLSGLYIAWCRTGINAKGLWHSKLDHVVINSCIDGVILRGHCVSIDFASCKIQAGAAVVAQDRYGIRVLSDANYSPATTRRPEAIKIHSETLVYGFQYNIDVETCLNFGLFGSDIDYGIKRGVRIGTVDGGLSIRDNWIAGDGDAGQLYYGIELSNVATDSGHRNTIVGNNLTMTGTPVAGCRAIQVGSLHGNAAIRDNTVYGGFEVGVYLELNSSRCVVEGNTLVAGNPVFVASSGHRIAANKFDGALFFHSASTRNDWGRNEGATTRELIVVTLPAGATSAAVTFASLGLKNIVANQRVFARAAQEGATSQGTISAEVSTTGVTVRTSTAVGVDTVLFVEVITV